MPLVLVLISQAPDTRLAGYADQARALLPCAGETAWLAPDEAAEIVLPDAPYETVEQWRAAVSDIVGDAAVDHAILPVGNRRKRLLVADMDSTVINEESLDEVAGAAGIKSQIAAITARAMRGELDFAAALRERIDLLRGFPETALAQVLEQRITLNPGARELVGTMRAHGAHTVLVSGGFTFFTEAVVKRAGFDVHLGNQLLFRDGRIAGVAEPIKGRQAKREMLVNEAQTHGISLTDTLAIGDGANDLEMLNHAGLSIAFHAKPVVAAQAQACIRFCDLTAALYLQGYPQSAITRF